MRTTSGFVTGGIVSIADHHPDQDGNGRVVALAKKRATKVQGKPLFYISSSNKSSPYHTFDLPGDELAKIHKPSGRAEYVSPRPSSIILI